MPVYDSTNLAPPDFGPEQPVYPSIVEMVRASGPAVAVVNGLPIYPGFVQQCTGPGAYRDRIPVYLQEPNGIILGPGIYNARLVSAYNGLPLYATMCCPTGAFPAASRSSSSSAAGH